MMKKSSRPSPCLRVTVALIGLTVATGATAASPETVGQQSPGQESAQARYVRSDRIIRLIMEVPVEPERVFDAWARADLLVEWFCHWVEDMSVTEGGTYRLGWDSVEAEWSGEFLEVERPRLMVFTWSPPAEYFPAGAYPTTIRLTFEDLGGTTRMVLEQSGFRGSEELESHLQQWTSYLYMLRAFLLQQSSG